MVDFIVEVGGGDGSCECKPDPDKGIFRPSRPVSRHNVFFSQIKYL